MNFEGMDRRLAAGGVLTPGEVEAVANSRDLPAIGLLGEQARRRRHGAKVSFVRVCVVAPEGPTTALGDAGEVRLVGTPASLDEARARVRDAVVFATRIPVTGFSLSDLFRLVNGDHLALHDAARALKAEGLDAIAEAPVDELGDADTAAESVQAASRAGLGVWTATLTQAPAADRLALIERAAAVQQQTRAFKAFAPLPRVDPNDQPSTGYDDVKTVALARLICGDIPSIQVDWRTYGPKLAQVAIPFGADDLDGVACVAVADLGHRRSPREEIERHIRMAGGEPVERDGRYEPRS